MIFFVSDHFRKLSILFLPVILSNFLDHDNKWKINPQSIGILQKEVGAIFTTYKSLQTNYIYMYITYYLNIYLIYVCVCIPK